jgi:hypothetical protein
MTGFSFHREMRMAKGASLLKFFYRAWFLAVLCLAVWGFNGGYAAAAEPFMKDKVQEALTWHINEMKKFLLDGDKAALKKRIGELTHPKTIFLFEFQQVLPGIGALPSKRAYYQRDPFVKLAEYADYIQKEGFEINYEVTGYKAEYGGKSAIVLDKGSAKGQFKEPVSGMVFGFNLVQSCRNTISASSETYLQYDSVYCRVKISYAPVGATDKTAPLLLP